MDLAADPRGDLGARKQHEVVHVKRPAREVIPAAVEVPAQPGAVHGSLEAGLVAAEVEGRPARQHARASAGHARGGQQAGESRRVGTVAARNRPVADPVERGYQLALRQGAALPVRRAEGVRDPQLRAGALQEQAVAPVPVHAWKRGLRA